MAETETTREEAERITAPMFDNYRKQFDRGDPLGAIDAIRLALMWSLPVPKWAANIAEAAIVQYFQSNGGAPGRGKAGGLKTQFKRDRMHRRRHQLVERELARGLSKTEAFARVAAKLGGYWQPRAIKASYKKVCDQLSDA